MPERQQPIDLIYAALLPYGQAEQQRITLSERMLRLAHGAGRVVACSMLAVTSFTVAAGIMDVQSGKVIWPDNETSINMVEGGPDQGKVWLVFGGLGQVSSENAAHQFYNAKKAAGEHESVAWIRYKNQGIDETDHDVLEEFIDTHDIEDIGVVGVSMGLPTALEWLAEIVDDAVREGKPVPWKISEMIGYSSPYDAFDPWKSSLLRTAADTEYPGGLYSKLGYNADWNAIFSGDSTKDQRLVALQEAVKKALNECSPALFMSQVQRLASANLDRWKDGQLRTLFMDEAKITYLIGANPDDTLDAVKAARKYEILAEALGALWRMLVVVGAGHADTFRSALALEETFREESYGRELRVLLSGKNLDGREGLIRGD